MQRTPRPAGPRPKKTWNIGNPQRKRAANFAIAGTGLLVVAGLGVAVVQEQRAEAQNAESVASYTPSTTYSPPPAPDTALFIGDSYTAGVGASSKATRWSTLVSEEMRWSEANYGLGGTGYVSTAGREGCGRESCPNYPDRLSESKGQVGPEFIIIAGGQNDFSTLKDDADTVEDVIQGTFAQAADTYPEAELIAVGPSDPGGTSDAAEALDSVVRDAAKAVGADFVSLIDPPVIDDAMVVEDGSHVNDAGHAAIAKRVLDSLRD